MRDDTNASSYVRAWERPTGVGAWPLLPCRTPWSVPVRYP